MAQDIKKYSTYGCNQVILQIFSVIVSSYLKCEYSADMSGEHNDCDEDTDNKIRL